MSQMPTIPGLHLEVDCAQLTYRLYDPLDSDEGKETIERALRVLSQKGITSKMKPWPESAGTFQNEHELVTCILELHRLKELDRCQVREGELPSHAEIAASPGRELFEPFSTNRVGKPQFQDEGPAYYEKLGKVV